MTLQQLVERIEGTEFAVELGVASLAETFVRGLQAQQEVADLYLALRTDSDRKYKLMDRVDALARREPDVRYDNRWDIPLATYVWVLDRIDPPLASIAAERVLSVRNLWWARHVANLVLRQGRAGEAADVLVAVQEDVGLRISRSEDVWDATLNPSFRQVIAHLQQVIEQSQLTHTRSQQLLDRSPNGIRLSMTTTTTTTTNVEELVA